MLVFSSFYFLWTFPLFFFSSFVSSDSSSYSDDGLLYIDPQRQFLRFLSFLSLFLYFSPFFSLFFSSLSFLSICLSFSFLYLSIRSMISMILSLLSWFHFVGSYLRSYSSHFCIRRRAVQIESGMYYCALLRMQITWLQMQCIG